MAKFTWRNAITVRVGELSRTAQFEVFNAFREMDGMSFNTVEAFYAEVETIIVLHAPVSILYNGAMTNKGTLHIDLEDTEPVDIALPLTREGFMNLPASLAAQWGDAALAENPNIEAALKKSMIPITPATSAPVSEPEPSAAPNLKT